MQRLPLINGVVDYINEKNIPFTMPGHKGGEGFLATEEGKIIYENVFKADITEVEGVDNLHSPKGIINESLMGLSEFYKSYKSYYLVNGSTGGNLTMIFSSFNKGEKIILERNCHRSIMNGVIMRELNPIYIESNIDSNFQCGFSYKKDYFKELLISNQDAKGIVITYPNYYGICIDLQFIVNEAKKYNMKVLVDCAHGAHFGVIDELPKNPMTLGCHMAVMSCHKTLSSFTQTAYLHINQDVNIEKVEFYLSAFMSTSPSYIMMMSMEYGWGYLKKYGYNKYKYFLNLCQEYRAKINQLNGFKVLDRSHMYSEKSEYIGTELDLTRFVINIMEGYSGYKFLKYLRDNKIQGEMSDGRNVILIPTPFNTKSDFEYLYDIIKKCHLPSLKDKSLGYMKYKIPKRMLLPHEVMDKFTEDIKYDCSEGRVSAVNIVPYPPGIPLLVQGEIIDKEVIDVIQYYLKNKLDILGVDNGKLKVVNTNEMK